MNPVFVYLLIITAISVVVTVLDKIAARRHAMRVPEAVLLLLAAMGGSVGMFFTMLIIRHKTQHSKFMIGIPVIFVLQIALLLFLVWRYTESKL
jgi:uncharacterized membrane protein YsdA (DUF1294 family)